MAAPRNNIPPRPRTAARPQGARSRSRIRGFVLEHRGLAVTLVAGLCAATIATVVVLAPPGSSGRYEPPIRARQYSAYTACLLTDSQGITSAATKPVWAAMQAASAATTAQASYLAIQGDATEANAETYLNTLALRGCNVIVTIGALPDLAARDRAGAYPKIHFAVVGPTVSLPSNASAIHPDTVRNVVESSYLAWKNAS